MIITLQYLWEHTDHIFVFGDNLTRSGYGGAAKLRDELNTYGFITKRAPDNDDASFYKPDEYKSIYDEEIRRLTAITLLFFDKKFLISRLGAGLANRYAIFEEVIEPNIKTDLQFDNVEFLW